MHYIILRIVPGLVFAVLAFGTVGCRGPSQFDVTGQVKYNGEPLDKPGGKIVFVGPNRAQVAAPIGPDGTYRATKVTAGLNQIAVYYPNPQTRGGKRFPSQRKDDDGLPTPSAATTFLTPLHYASAETSKLSVQVEKGTVFNVDLSGPPIP